MARDIKGYELRKCHGCKKDCYGYYCQNCRGKDKARKVSYLKK